MGGERTNITFYSDVRVPDSARVGEVDAGWSVMHAALVYERTSANWGEPNHLVESVAGVGARARRRRRPPVRRPRRAGQPSPGPAPSSRSGGSCCSGPPGSSSRGEMPQVEGSMAKLHITEAFVRASSELLDLLGTGRPAPRLGARRRAAAAWSEHAFRHAVVTTIYGGSSEVQREIIAGRALGLPRSR